MLQGIEFPEKTLQQCHALLMHCLSPGRDQCKVCSFSFAVPNIISLSVLLQNDSVPCYMYIQNENSSPLCMPVAENNRDNDI